MKIPKILVFTPIYEGKDYCLPRFLEHANKLSYPNFRHIYIDNSKTDEYYKKLLSLGLDAHRVERGNSSREALARAQNFARQIAIDENYDYIFSLESDIMVCPDLLQRLMLNGKDVCSALYFIGPREDPNKRIPCICLPKLYEKEGWYGTRLLEPEELKTYIHNGLRRVHTAGMGCCLIYKNVFQRFPFYYEVGLQGHSDIYFFNDCFRTSVSVWVDTDILLDHENSSWADVQDR